MSESLVKQEFLTELESILESDEAYGSNVQVLTYSVKKDVINGKFKDSWNKRVYEFVIDIDGISYKPAAKLDSFSADELPVRFDAYSEGYRSLFEDTRLDGKLTGKRTKKPKCGNEGYGCGFSCIGLTKTCRILSSGRKTKGDLQERAIGKERLNKLIIMSGKLYAEGNKGGAALASAIANKITGARGEKAKQLVEVRKEKLAQRQNANKDKPTASETTIPIDKTLFDIKFPQEVKGATNSYESLVDRVYQAQAMVKGKDSYFADATPSEKGHILRDMVQEYYGADIDYDARLKNAVQLGNKNEELYTRAAITRLQAARQLWENLPEKQKRIVARTLKYEEQDRTLLTQKGEVKNQYINELRKEFAKYIAPPKPQEKKPAKPKPEPTKPTEKLKANSKSPTVDQEVFNTIFPPKEVQREYGQGGVIDRAKEVISFVQNPKAFNDLTSRDKAGFLDNITTIHGVGDKNHHETINLPAVQNDKGRKMGVEASNVRAQGAKQIWDNLTLNQKTELAKNLKDIKSKLAEKSIPGIVDTSNEFKNEYVNQLANEIRELIK